MLVPPMIFIKSNGVFWSGLCSTIPNRISLVHDHGEEIISSGDKYEMTIRFMEEKQNRTNNFR